MAKDSRDKGQAIELLVKQHLIKNGLSFIQQNYHSRFGEIDLIFLDKLTEPKTLVFVEVRYRARHHYGSGAESVTYSKQKKLLKTAQFFLQAYPDAKINARFDVMAVTKGDDPIKKGWQFQWFKNAFSASPW